MIIFLKIDTLIAWNWTEVFWPYWVLFSVLIGISFGLFFMFLSKCCQMIFASSNMMERNEKKLAKNDLKILIVKGMIWMLIMCLTFTVITCMTVISIGSLLDDESGNFSNHGLIY